MEVWDQVKTEDWALVGMMTHPAAWAQRLWAMDKYYHHTGATGAAGVGYGLAAAVGASEMLNATPANPGRVDMCTTPSATTMERSSNTGDAAATVERPSRNASRRASSPGRAR